MVNKYMVGYDQKIAVIFWLVSACTALHGQNTDTTREVTPELSGDIRVLGNSEIHTEITVLADAFARLNPSLKIKVEGSGLPNRIFHPPQQDHDVIYMFAGEPEDSVVKQLTKNNTADLTQISIARQNVYVFANNDSHIVQLSAHQLKSLYFEGKNIQIQHPTKLGDQNEEAMIQPNAMRNSATSSTLLRFVIGGGCISEDIPRQDSLGSMFAAVSKNGHAMGYSITMRPGVKVIPIAGEQGGPAILPPLPGTVGLGTAQYPLSWPIKLAFDLKRTGREEQQFLKFVLSEEGQNVLKTLDSVSLLKAV